MNPTFPMRTGFNLTEALTTAQRQTLERLLLVFSKQAFQYAGAYAEAAGRSVITWRDVELGLKVAAMPTFSYNFWAQDLSQELEEIDTLLASDETEDEEIEDEEAEVEWTAAASSHSSIIQRMNEVEALWETWQPQDTMGRALKRALSSMT